MLLSDLIKIIRVNKTYNFKKNKIFFSITSNSKFTNKNTIFIWNKNLNLKNEYLIESLRNKIPAIISNKYHKFANIPQFIVSNINLETDKLLKKMFNPPFKSVAVTGTNGKTSVVWYISKILTSVNIENTTLGTLGYFNNGKKTKDTNLTTPACTELYKYGSRKNIRKNTFIFEASSHALDQNRLRNFPINIAAITNISSDHLDYHKTLKEYKNAKYKLFSKYLLENGIAVINSRIKNINKLIKILNIRKIKVIIFGEKNIFFKKNKKNFKLYINKNKYIIDKLNLSTDIELQNLECAIACCLALDIEEKKIVKVLHNIKNPPGRLQKFYYKKKNCQIIVDYAHTPEALKKVLLSLVSNNKKPVLLFGCGGDRDKGKRKKMAIIAKDNSSRVYITDDNPRNEDPTKIRKEILRYCTGGIEVPGRKKAIIKALKDLNKNETLIIAGKGHENIQILKNREINLNDAKIVKNIFKNEL